MAERQMLALAAALVLVAAALWLWGWSARERARQRAGAHLERQLRAADEPALEMAPWMRALAELPEAAAPAAEPATAAPARPLERWLPGGLKGVVSLRQLLAGLAVALAGAAVAGLAAGPLAAASTAVLCAVFGAFALWLAVQRFRRRLRQQMPPFIDSMVRLITIGNSTQAAFQLSIGSAAAPLRDHLEHAAGLIRAGVEMDQALHQTARTVRIEEMSLLAGILGLSVRYGGRTDLLLERVANFMRDREQAEQELNALSAETRLSAWILGLLPVGVGFTIVMLNAAYFIRMWTDPAGRMLIFGAAALQVLGAVMLYRLARLE